MARNGNAAARRLAESSAGLCSVLVLTHSGALLGGEQASQCNVFLAGHGRTLMCEVQDDQYAHAKFEPVAGMVGHALATGEVCLSSDAKPRRGHDAIHCPNGSVD